MRRRCVREIIYDTSQEKVGDAIESTAARPQFDAKGTEFRDVSHLGRCTLETNSNGLAATNSRQVDAILKLGKEAAQGLCVNSKTSVGVR